MIEEWEKQIDEINWSGTYEITIENGKYQCNIEFEKPISLPKAKSTNQSLIKKIKENTDHTALYKLIDERYESSITSKYNNKRTDSFNSYIRILAFNYILDKEEGNYDLQEFFKQFEFKKLVEKDVVNYTNKYIQYHSEVGKHKREYLEEHFKKIKCIASDSKECKKEANKLTEEEKEAFNNSKDKYNVHFEENFKYADFKSMLVENNQCCYCGISLNNLYSLREKGKISSKSGRGFSMEIDRRSPNLEYSKENCCMSCYWCNNAKTDEFSVKEFEPIAKGINIVWNKRLGDKEGDKAFDNIIKFPYDTYKEKIKPLK
ncbi:MAG: hypothetical protein DRG78_00980 [Epsilonproteobacteria bacterium]|nr:MAG: hypothetical protein DRG78_00980 [Campylobacterota bacterium]